MKKWDIRYMKLAQEVSTWSKDPSSQIGAVAIAPDKACSRSGATQVTFTQK